MTDGVTTQERLALSLISLAACSDHAQLLAHTLELSVSQLGCTHASFVDAAGAWVHGPGPERAGLAADAQRLGELVARPLELGAIEAVPAGLLIELSHAGRRLGRLVLTWGRDQAAPERSDWRLRALASALTQALVNSAEVTGARTREHQLRAIMENTSSVVFIKDLAGRYTVVNPQLLESTGFSAEKIIGKTDHELFDAETAARIVANDRHVLESGERGEFEGVTQFPSGPRVFLTTKFPLRNEEGRVYALCGISRDISERKRLERTKQLDTLGRLAQGVAHDFNNVLMSVLVAGELIDELVPPPRSSTIDTALQAISESCERAADLTSKLLLFSSEAHRPREPVELHAIVEAAAQLLRSGDRSAEISTNLMAEGAWVHGDAGQLRNAVLQLGLNARDASSAAGGTIVFVTRELELSEAECSDSGFELTAGTHVELEVRDTGSGIPPDLLPRIFEPFFTTKQTSEGAGLGLVAVHGTVVSHKGSVEVHSRVGEGTRMFLRLPKVQAPVGKEAMFERRAAPSTVEEAPASASGPASGLSSEPGPYTILLVDDEPAVRRTVKLQLESLGFTVRTATDGFEGIERFAEHHEELCAVILDMVMPKLGGAGSYARMREIDASVPVIVCSGYVPGDDMQALQREGIAGFLGKPYRRAQLKAVLDRVLGLGC